MDQKSDSRILYLDLLRVFSIFAMMFLHVAASQWMNTPVSSMEWQVFNIYDSLVRFCVPVFVMISGVFFLDPDRPFSMKKLFTKNIFRIVTAFLFWSACYAVPKNIIQYRAFHMEAVKSTLKDFLVGHYHLWFLFTLVGLYLIVPFLRKICESKALMQYYLLMSFVFAWSMNLLKLVPVLERGIIVLQEQMNLFFFLGYSGYFVLGFYLSRYLVAKTARNLVYALGALSVCATIFGTSLRSLSAGVATEGLYSFLLPTTCLASAAVFLFFKENVSRIRFSRRAQSVVMLLSKGSFGMYLVHEFVNVLFKDILHFTTLTFHPILSVPVITVLVFAISFCISLVIHKIPVLTRYIV